jgi:hypothetical protein
MLRTQTGHLRIRTKSSVRNAWSTDIVRHLMTMGLEADNIGELSGMG